MDHSDIIVLETYDPVKGFNDGLSIVYDRLREIGVGLKDTRSISNKKVVVCGIPFSYEDRIKKRNFNVLVTTFESDKLPDFWVKSINKYYKACIVPHETIKKVFSNSGVKIPLFVVHQGYTRYGVNLERNDNKSSFRIGFLGVPVARKNLIKLYKACQKLKKDHIPGLILSIHVSTFYDWLDPEMFSFIKGDAFVNWTDGSRTKNEMANWFNSLSCYVYPSSGEGWSFTPRESLYMGVPTILSDIPVHVELAKSNYCKVIKTSGFESANFNGHVWGNWARISEEEIYESILDVYSHYAEYIEISKNGSCWIANQWKNEDMRAAVCNIILSL